MRTEIHIVPEGPRVSIVGVLRELLAYRELVWVFVERDIRIRYKQTYIGVAWAFIQPFLTMIVFTLFFGQLAKMPSDGVPYPLFSFAGVLPWQYFARSITEGSASLRSNSGLLTKVYFPREILPISTVTAGLVDLLIGMFFLIILMLAFGFVPGPRMLWCVPLILLAWALALAMAFWVSSAAAIYRDIGFAIPFVVQLLMFATPVIYPLSLVPEDYRFVYALNPMVLVIEGYRWSVIGSGAPPDLTQVVVSVVIIGALLIGGLSHFNRTARLLADKI